MTDFSDLGLSPDLLKSVADTGYTTPTPIQAQAIPYVLMGRDVLGCAQTGTGKTAAFTLPMIDILSGGRARARMPRTLILEPTRELAAQVSASFEVYGANQKLSMALLIGGESFSEQERKLDRGVDVLIATPGRLMDLFERGKILLSDVKILVIDEADRMLDMGFIPDIEKIVSLLPAKGKRQTLFFSATMPPEIRRLADAFLIEPKEVTVAPPASTAINVTQGLIVVHPEDKTKALRKLIEIEDVKNAIIFCNRKRDVDILQKGLKGHGFDVVALHGDMAQANRTATLEKFKNNEVRLLVASDVAARGLDVAGLSHVFNFDVPIHAEDYVHRIGRTGRAGNLGRAFTFALPEEGRNVAAIVKLIGKEIPAAAIEGFESPALEYDDVRRGRGGRGRSGSSSERAPRGDRPARGEKPAKSEAAPRIEPAIAEQPEDAPRPERTPRPPRRAPRSAPARQIDQPIQMGGADGITVTPMTPRPVSGDRDRHRRRDQDDDNERIVGFGDHLPAFLARPLKVSAGR